MSNRIGFKTFPWDNRFEFEDFDTVKIDGVRHYQTPEGNLPSMTTVLGILTKDSTFLQDWVNRIGQKEADRISKESSGRGDALHEYNEKYLKGELKREELTGQAKILFNRSRRYVDEIEKVYGTEVALYNSKGGYAGRADVIAQINSELTTVDFKNSRKPISKDVDWKRRKLFTYMLQCVGYAEAMYQQYGERPKKGCIIVSNFETSNAQKFEFDIDPLIDELYLVVNAFYNSGEGIDKSMYFSL